MNHAEIRAVLYEILVSQFRELTTEPGMEAVAWLRDIGHIEILGPTTCLIHQQEIKSWFLLKDNNLTEISDEAALVIRGGEMI